MKKITILALGLLISLTSIQAQNWTKLGTDINGEAAHDNSGLSVSLSSDGSIVAIGAPYNDENGTDAGNVCVYQNISGVWTKLGDNIDGEAVNDYSGKSISLSSNGLTVAIGASGNDGNGTKAGHVRIYEYTSGAWVQKGADIDGEAANDWSGYSVSLSSNGSIVAIGAHGNDGNGTNAGQVRIFEYISGAWMQKGADIEGEAAGDWSGYSVSLSSDGSIVAIGAQNNDGNGVESGHVRIYEYTSGAWVQKGADIDGEAAGDKFGKSVSLSSDGLTVAVGAPNNDGNGTDAGHVRVYKYTSGAWTQIGSDIDGEAAGDYSGKPVSLSPDGLTVAIGAPENDANGENAGHVRVYKYTSGAWTQIGLDINGEAASNEFGSSVNLNSDGSIVAIGEPFDNAGGASAGRVRIYTQLPIPHITNQPDNQENICIDSNVSFSISGTDIDTYQWQVDEGGGFENIIDDDVYSNAQTATLNISGVTFDMSYNQYRCIATNVSGSVASNIVELITDFEEPVTPTLPNITGECSATVTAPTTTDNCAGTVTGTTTDPTVYTEQGTYVITWEFDDGNDNYVTATQNVIINDNTDPETPTLPNITGECSATATAPTTTDNCAGTITGTTTDPLTYSTQGTYTITWNFNDGNGNDINVNQNVIIEDVTNPTISCIDNQTKQLSEGEIGYTVSGTEFDPTATDDNCEVASVINDFNNLSTLNDAEFPIGTTTIVWTVTDIAGNSTTCNFDVQVNAYVGISELKNFGISIYPNPTNGVVNFEFVKNNIQKIVISDITGKTLIKKTNIQQNETIDLSSFESGIYIIKIQTDKEIFTTKIVKK